MLISEQESQEAEEPQDPGYIMSIMVAQKLGGTTMKGQWETILCKFNPIQSKICDERQKDKKHHFVFRDFRNLHVLFQVSRMLRKFIFFQKHPKNFKTTMISLFDKKNE